MLQIATWLLRPAERYRTPRRLYRALPNCTALQGRAEILRVHINQRGLPLSDDVRVDQLAAQVCVCV